MAKHGIKLTDEILDFNTVEDFAVIRAEYKQKTTSKILLHRM